MSVQSFLDLARQEQALQQSLQDQMSAGGLSPEQRQALIDFMTANQGGFLSQFRSAQYPTLSDADLITAYNKVAADSRDRAGNGFTDFVVPLAAGGLVGGAALGTLAGGGGAATGGTAGAAGGEFTGGLTGTAAGSPGFTGLAAGSPGLAGAGGGALAPGFFAGEALYPVIGGGAAATGATGLGTGSAGASSLGTGVAAGTATGGALGKLSEATGLDPGTLQLLGIAGATGLGVYGANQQGNALRDIANQARADRAPFLGAATNWLNNPMAYAEGPGKTFMDATLRRLSTTGGNPIDQPTSLGLATQAGLQDWRNAVLGFGNLGLAGEDTRAQVMSNAVGADAGVYNALGYGLGQITNPPSSIEQLLRQIGGRNSMGLG